MNVLIVEDEPLAAERLTLLLRQYDHSVNVIECLESIEQAVQWLQTRQHPDLLLMDIQLSDGHSFEIFKQVNLHVPIIFTTAYDHYAINAFRHFSIDYILKPVTAETLATAIQKYRMMPKCFSLPDYQSLTDQFQEKLGTRYKDRFLAKVGQRTFFIQTETVAFFYADNKTVYLVDETDNRFMINYSIEKLEQLLDPYYFFKINRSMIVHSKMIDLARPYLNNRVKLTLKNIKHPDDIIVSRERVAAFRKWADG